MEKQNLSFLQQKKYDQVFALENTNYEPIDKIGIGAYGVVCSAVSKITKRKVAIKKIPRIFEQPALTKRTYREIKILKYLKHENVIGIKEILRPAAGASDELKDVYIVLDLMESDLHRIIHSKQELSEEHVRYFLYQILRGLKYIHSAHIVHRDLKPSNLLVNENCDLKIGDFGMARGVDSEKEIKTNILTQYVATRWYRAPELLVPLDCNYGSSVDIWSAGCILGEMLGRKQLFRGNNALHQLKVIVETMGAAPKSFVDRINSGMCRTYLTVFDNGKIQPMPLKLKYPNASKSCVDLLSSMLQYDVDIRATAISSLRHPFLAKYHNPDDEPTCAPPFDFGFEKFSDEEMKTAVSEEILESDTRRKINKLTGFNLTFVPKSQLKNKPKAKNKKVEPVFKKPADPVTVEPKTEFQEVQPIPAESLTVNAECDIDMLTPSCSAKTVEMKSANDLTDDVAAPSTVDAVKPEIEQEEKEKVVVIISNNLIIVQQDAKADVRKLLDAKAALRNAILNPELRRSKNDAPRPKPVTALQRQRQREEKRRQKMVRAEEKRKKKSSKSETNVEPVLTDDDKKLLEKWSSITPHKDSKRPDLKKPTSNVTQRQLPDTPPQLFSASSTSDVINTDVTRRSQIPSQRAPYAIAAAPHDDAKLLFGGCGNAPVVPPSIALPLSGLEALKLSGLTGVLNMVPVFNVATSQSCCSTAQTTIVHPVPSAVQPATLPVANNPASVLMHGHVSTMGVAEEPVVATQSVPVSMSSLLPRIGPNNTKVTDEISEVQPISTTSATMTSRLNAAYSICGDLPADVITSSKPSCSTDINQNTAESTEKEHPTEEDPLNVVTKQMSRSHVDDLTLQLTPKGTGQGYGMGPDLDILTDNARGLDSGSQISASLLADWNEISRGIDPQDLGIDPQVLDEILPTF